MARFQNRVQQRSLAVVVDVVALINRQELSVWTFSSAIFLTSDRGGWVVCVGSCGGCKKALVRQDSCSFGCGRRAVTQL